MEKKSPGKYILVFEPRYASTQYAVYFKSNGDTEITEIKKYSDVDYKDGKTIKKNTLKDIDSILTSYTDLEQFFKDLNLPVRFSEANLPTHEIELLTQKLLSDRPSVGRFVTIDKQAAMEIYQLAL